MKKVLFLRPPIHPIAIELLEKETEVSIADVINPEESIKYAKDVNGIIIRYPSRIDRDFIFNCRQLEAISINGAGYEHVDIEAATEKKIPVTYTPGVNHFSVAEHSVALMIAAAKNIVNSCLEVRKGNWKVRETIRTIELKDKTVGIIGLGPIGQTVAQICTNGFNMKVYSYKYSRLTDKRINEFMEKGIGFMNTLDELLINSDFIFLCLPLREQNKHLIGKRELELIKSDAYLINTSRGAIVNQKDLVEALEKNLIAGAGLDTVDPEPPGVNEPLLSIPNAVITPHCSGLTEDAMRKMGETSVYQLLQVLRGKIPSNLLNDCIYK